MATAAPKIPRDRPLSGLCVLDFSFMMAGPYCTRMLADMGATVLKIESPAGDHIRGRPPLRDGWSTYYGHLNAGKQSIVLDLKRPEAVAVVKRLAATCDVAVENFRPGVMKRLGLDYDTLAEVNPGLVYCAISGFGQSGPGAGRPAYAPVVHAASGYDRAHLSYQDDTERPAKTGIFMADVMAGIHACAAIEAALLARQRTGQGQMIDVSLIESMFNLLVYEVQEAQYPSNIRRPLYEPLRAADGFVIVAPVTQNNFENLARCVGHPEWQRDPRFATARDREQHWGDLMALVEEWTLPRPGGEVESILMAAGVPCSRYLSIAEAMDDPHCAARGSFATIEDPAGRYRVPNLPFQMSAMETSVNIAVSAHGADGEAVLRDRLGLGPEDIADLRACGALGT